MKTDRNDRTKALLTDLETGIDRLVTSAEWQHYLTTAAKFHRYSFGNILLIQFQKPDATRVAGFKKWIELNRHVRKGEHAIWILAPILVKDRDADDPDSAPRRLVGYKSVPVFDISQTDGEPLPEPVHELHGEAPEGLYKHLTDVALAHDIKTVTDADLGETNGVTYADARIEINADRDPLQRVKTLAHEIGHWDLGHLSGEVKITRGQAELEAESVAYVVLAAIGLDSGDYSFGYVTHWSGQDGEEARKGIRASAARIQKAATKILDALESAE